MITGWRIVKRQYAASAFDGEGARLFGGRWNSAGEAVVYVAGSQSLAILEMLTHLGRAALLQSYVVIGCAFDDKLVTELDPKQLPDDWRVYPAPEKLQIIGNHWLRAKTSVALRVPSVIVPAESNYLLNPSHRDFKRVAIQKPEPFQFDLRLATPAT